jgi:hypothetical protein
VETCPTCRFIVPEDASTCRVCHGDPSAVVIDERVEHAAPARRGASRLAPLRPLVRMGRRTSRWYARNGRHLRLGLVAVVGAAATTMMVVPARAPDRPAAVVDIAPVEAYDWRPFQPDDGALRVELPSEPTPHTATDGMHYRVDLGGVRLVIGSFTLADAVVDPVGHLRAVAARTGEERGTAVEELRVGTHPWGSSLDVRLAGDRATVLLRLTVAGEHLYVIEGDLLPALAADPDSEAMRAYDRVVGSFTPTP